MTASATQLCSRWPSGRIAAAVLFLGGVGWAVAFARWSEFPKVYLPGYIVWVLWGLRAAGVSHARFRNLTWAISTVWHLIWFLFVLWLLPGFFSLIWLVGLQMAWSVIAFITSVIFLERRPASAMKTHRLIVAARTSLLIAIFTRLASR